MCQLFEEHAIGDEKTLSTYILDLDPPKWLIDLHHYDVIGGENRNRELATDLLHLK